MKTLEQVLNQFESECIDNRDANRLARFVPEEHLDKIGIELKDEFKGKHVAEEFTRENILEQLKSDVAFGFEKALGQRGISASLMFEVVKMWNWILEEGLEDFDEYPMYGLPLFKATALKYGFDNPIGNDNGDESKYESE
ncbi:hypothetical protein [Sulfuricurvum sp.]|uniref:hypothetical protein n=1 Tax=Sulfuricurvum sp. TaxID=2025608 RepID=UPI00356ADE10